MKKVRMIVEMDEDLYKALLSGYEEPYSRMFSDTVKTATPLTESDDAVSRQAVKNGMIKYGFHASDMTVTEFVEDELAPVLPKREQGKWITQYHVAHQKEYIYCSECREEFSYDGETGIEMSDYKYCPNCGAGMR